MFSPEGEQADGIDGSARVAQDDTTTAFFDRTYDETLALLEEARFYIAEGAGTEAAALGPEARMRFARESMRITSRLSQVMAWLLAQKAVHAGELGRDDVATGPYALDGQNVCEPAEPELSEGLPRRLCSLLDRSHALYTRVSRLDAMVREQTAG